MSEARRGPDGLKVIQTFPPLPETTGEVALSPATGQPRRNPVMLVGAALLYAASAVITVAFALFWWDAINIAKFTHSARLLEWTDPRPGSWQSIVLVCLVALAALSATAAPSIAAFQAWNGHRWSRVAGLIAVAVSLLTILLNNLALVAIPLAAAGTGILWLGTVGDYFDQWAAFRAEDVGRPQVFGQVRYGPRDRYRALGN